MNIIHFEKIDSTNNYAKKHLHELQPPVIVYADIQTKGRGRFERRFISPYGGLYMSMVLEWDEPLLNMIVPVGITEALKKINIDASVFWPNDIYLNRKKLGGILIEMAGKISIIGIGLNVNSRIKDFPFGLRKRITTLFHETGKQYDITELMVSIAEEILGLAWKKEYLHSLYTEKLSGIGERVRIEVPGEGTIDGIIKGVTEKGYLLLDTGGAIKEVCSGTVISS